MNSSFTNKYLPNVNRTIYNSIINSALKTINKNRQASSLDYFPTTLASLGVSIEGERLGLGTNLFSDNQTLIEELGLKTLNKELSKKSIYYNNNFINNNK